MRPEYVLWARPRGSTDALDEQVMTCTAIKFHLDTVKLQAMRDGWHTFRVQVIDGTRPDFAGTVAPTP